MDETDAHVERARRAYRSFRILSDKNLMEDAFSRGYYALLHLGFALLLKHGQQPPKTHAGLVARLWAVKGDLGLEEEAVKTFSRFQALRESGDYAAIPAVEKKDVQALEAVVKKFFGLLGEKI